MFAILALHACILIAPEAPPHAPQPMLIRGTSRGPFVVREYYESRGPEDRNRAWCEVQVDGTRFDPVPGADYQCSLGPVAEPPALTLLVLDGAQQGLYLVTLMSGEPRLQLVRAPARMFAGAWTADGRYYVFEQRAWDIASHTSFDLPPYKGYFLGFDPGMTSLVSTEQDESGTFVHRTSRATGAVETRSFSALENPFRSTETHDVLGCYECHQVWEGQHLVWRERADGGWDYELRTPTPSAVP